MLLKLYCVENLMFSIFQNGQKMTSTDIWISKPQQAKTILKKKQKNQKQQRTVAKNVWLVCVICVLFLCPFRNQYTARCSVCSHRSVAHHLHSILVYRRFYYFNCLPMPQILKAERSILCVRVQFTLIYFARAQCGWQRINIQSKPAMLCMALHILCIWCERDSKR